MTRVLSVHKSYTSISPQYVFSRRIVSLNRNVFFDPEYTCSKVCVLSKKQGGLIKKLSGAYSRSPLLEKRWYAKVSEYARGRMNT